MLHGFKEMTVDGKTGEIISELVDGHYKIYFKDGSQELVSVKNLRNVPVRIHDHKQIGLNNKIGIIISKKSEGRFDVLFSDNTTNRVSPDNFEITKECDRESPKNLQILPSSPSSLLDTLARIYKLDQAWFRNVHAIILDIEKTEPFENMESQTIERFYKEYLESAGNSKFRMVVLGHWTVDLKKMHLVMTDDPDNSDHFRKVLRSKTHRRPRLDDSRFSSPITASLQRRSITEGAGVEIETPDNYFANWLGLEWWIKHNNKIFPSLFQIETGLINEAMVQLIEAMMNVADLKAHVEAK